MTDPVVPGLDGVLAGDSAICEVDHAALRYRGYLIDDLAAQASFEEVAFLLLFGTLPNRNDLDLFQDALIGARNVPSHIVEFLRAIPESVNRMDALRTAVSILGLDDPDTGSNTHAANLRKGIRLCAQMPALLAALVNRSDEASAMLPENGPRAHSEYLLTLLTGSAPDAFSSKVIDVSLILYAEHEFNASTFAARVTASSMSDLHSAVTSAIGTLKGPLHGGANEAVMAMLLEIDAHGDVQRYLSGRLAKKEKIMGFGHRVLRKGDPRSDIIKGYAKSLGEARGELKWASLSAEIEETMLREKGLYPNLDFYSASAYYLLGLPISIYTPLFVCSRITGWAAHIMEQHESNRLIRPRCRYTGEGARPFLPLADRS